MKTKLTLSVDKELVELARIEARNENQSVSSLFSEFIKTRRNRAKVASTSVNDMVGTLKGYAIDDSKSAIRSANAKKHLY